MINSLQLAPIYVIIYIFILGIVVTVHELGHFLVAKALGTKIDCFSWGFGPAWAKRTDKSGVEWRLSLIPIGGYVRFAGDENAASVPDLDDLEALRRDLVAREGVGALNRYYHFKPVWHRAAIAAAGPAANFLLTIVIFAGLLFFLGEPRSPARIETVVPGGPAARAGLLPNDLIVEADGKVVKTIETVRQLIILRTGTPISLLVDRGGKRLTIIATPERGEVQDAVGHKHRLGMIGVKFSSRPQDRWTQRYGPLEALGGGAYEGWDRIDTTIHYLTRLLSGQESGDQLSGPIGIAQMEGDLARQVAAFSPDSRALVINGALTLLEMVASISVAIGFVNLLPIPMLDGGHLLFYAYEAVARRPLTAKVQAAGYRVGLALVLGLMLFATWNDLQRLHVFNFIGRLI